MDAADQNSKHPHPVEHHSTVKHGAAQKQAAKESQPSSSAKTSSEDNKGKVGTNAPPPASKPEEPSKPAQLQLTLTLSSGGLDTKTAGEILDTSGLAATTLEQGGAKIGDNLKLYTNPMARGNQYYGIAADMGKVGKALGPAGFAAGVVLDGAAVAQGKEDVGEAALNTGMGAAAFFPPYGTAAATGYTGFKVGNAIDNLPSGSGRTVGENMSLGTQSLVAPNTVQMRPLDVPTRTDANGTPY